MNQFFPSYWVCSTMSKKIPFDLQPTLTGSTISLRPLQAEDFEALYLAASDPLIWEQHPSPLRYQRDVFEQEFFIGALASGSAFVVFENESSKIIGSSRFYDWDPIQKEVAIGFTFLARSHWGGTSNQQKKRLMLDHAWQWAERVWFHIGRNNWRSRKAVEKIGASFSHDAIKELNGVVHEYAFYKMEKVASPSN